MAWLILVKLLSAPPIVIIPSATIKPVKFHFLPFDIVRCYQLQERIRRKHARISWLQFFGIIFPNDDITRAGSTSIFFRTESGDLWNNRSVSVSYSETNKNLALGQVFGKNYDYK